jgi:uncharacterized protein YqgC (DUF456 family)
MEYFWAVLLFVMCLVSWTLNVASLPGNWIVVALCVLYGQFGPAEGRLDIGWGAIVTLLVLAIAGEIIELLAGAMGAKHVGGSKRGAALALVGSMLGSLVGLCVGVPIPVIGPLAGAILFAGLGATVGAVIGERWKGRDFDESLRVGEAAFWGRLLGTLGKGLVGALMVAVVGCALVLFAL